MSLYALFAVWIFSFVVFFVGFNILDSCDKSGYLEKQNLIAFVCSVFGPFGVPFFLYAAFRVFGGIESLRKSQSNREISNSNCELIEYIRSGDKIKSFQNAPYGTNKKVNYTFLGWIDSETMCLFKGDIDKQIGRKHPLRHPLDKPERIVSRNVFEIIENYQLPEAEKRKQKKRGYENYAKLQKSKVNELFQKKNEELIQITKEDAERTQKTLEQPN